MINFCFFLTLLYISYVSSDFFFLKILFLFGIFSFFMGFCKEGISLLSFFFSIVFCKYYQYEIKEKLFFFLSDNFKNFFYSFLIMFLTICIEFFIIMLLKKRFSKI